ncbi:hypothetical protein ACIQH6_24545 [Micromonospora orduensis]|uniref:hypothetical protein n=1 Tax=Micromonospora orduensis TaxID=1420891 RepID=UPI00363EADC9
MTDGTIHTNGRAPRWVAPASCAGAPADPIGLGPTRYENPDDLEAAALLRAFTAGNASVRQSQEPVNAASAEVVARYHAARGRIDQVDRFRARGSVVEALDENDRVVRRHAGDGPEDRRRRAMHPRLLWFVLGLSALFDASFIGSLMQQIFDVDWKHPLFYFAYLPGVGIAVCLYAAGVELATHLLRRRDRLSRRRTLPPLNPAVALRRLFWDWRPEPLDRREDDLPWSRLPGPVLFGALVLGLLGVAALVRAQSEAAEFEWLAVYQPAFVVLLILLSIGAIAVKVQSHNPYADSSERAERRIADAEGRADRLVQEARDAVAAHGQSWDALQSAISAAKATAREVVEEACAVLLETRSRGRKRDDTKITLPLVRLAWPAETGSVTRDDTQLPGLDLGLLDYAAKAAERYRPEGLESCLQAAVDKLNGQFEALRTDVDDPTPGDVAPA